ncbi:biosynthetic-type acetolactate synthase large subunit [Candidatus Karelsulcia muelleri]|uniref:Acetolactate synthase n=1 Tax=Candidatus Karelsulcia muelleri PSPU TaxID=1189303 RepID=A0AAD1EY98_9FLAO|nr:biosynthetic-type acetolactate synthase large subunit [Candidatus Karelsulcia muelleri]NJJ98780.1 biosynthetic-type acetolactate synthase large subunit [Candidatus Karelsulcia muelleri]BAO66432.1 acetolactate synthase large subunit [Candidatus Karelsulcia muelleri PSPU]
MNKYIKGSEIIIKTLILEKTKYIFGYPGGAIMPIYDALYYYIKQISHILTRHEQGAIHAAQGYARVSGKVGVCFTTSGPGATNLITGLADSLIDSTAILCITGQVSSNLLGTDAFQETDIIDISIPVTKWNYQVTKAKDISYILSKGFFIAQSGRPGPVLIDITKDAQLELSNFKYKKYLNIFLKKKKINIKKIEKAATIINNSSKPFIIIGQGIILANAEKELKEFIEKTNIPAASTLLGLGALKTENILNMGMLGMHGHYAPNILTNKSDVIIAIGMRFDDRVTGDLTKYAKKSNIIHIDIDESEIHKNMNTNIFLLGNCKKILKLLLSKIEIKKNKKWKKFFFFLKKKEEKKVIKNDYYTNNIGITMGEVINYINLFKKKKSVLVTDVGQHQMSASRYFNFTCKKSQITSGGLGTMGFALPASIGAKIWGKNCQIICIVGDGGIQMTLQELGTIMQHNITIKIILLNNNYLGMVRQWQEFFFERRYSSTKIINPDFIKMFYSYGIKYKKILNRKYLKQDIKDLLNTKNTYILEIMIEKEYKVFPMITPGNSIEKIRLKSINE